MTTMRTSNGVQCDIPGCEEDGWYLTIGMNICKKHIGISQVWRGLGDKEKSRIHLSE